MRHRHARTASRGTARDRTFFDQPPGGTPNGAGAGAGATRRWLPPMDLVETDEHFVLRADLPGVSEDDVSIELEDDVLTITVERKAEHEDAREGFYRLERSFGQFRRSLTLPEGVDPAGITAAFDKGVLEVRVPKPEERKPRRVAIQVGDARNGAIEGAETE